MMETIAPYKSSVGMFKEEILREFESVIELGILVLGDQTKRFEEEFALSHERMFGIAVNSDTAALEAALALLKDLEKLSNLVVLMPDTAFFGCANVVFRLGGRVVPVPVTIENGIMPTLGQLKDAVGWVEAEMDIPADKLVYMAVYTGGTVGRDSMEQISWCRGKGIKVIEDCAHAHGATYTDGNLAGHYGDISTFSFYATKMIHSGEGGMLLVDNPQWDRWLRTYRNYGKTWGPDADPVFQDVSVIGYNWRMTEFQAALGRIMWRNYPQIYKGRRKVEKVYDNFIGQSDGRIRRLIINNVGLLMQNLYRYIVMVDGLETEEQNHKLYEQLESKGVRLQAKCNSKPLTETNLFKNLLVFYPEAFSFPKEALSYSMGHLCLPIYPTLTEEEALRIAETVVEVVQSNTWK